MATKIRSMDVEPMATSDLIPSSFVEAGAPVSESPNPCQETHKPGSVGSLVSAETKETGVLWPLSTSEDAEQPPSSGQYRKLQSFWGRLALRFQPLRRRVIARMEQS